MKALRPRMLVEMPTMSVQVAWVRAAGWSRPNPSPPYPPGNWDIWAAGFTGVPR